MNILKLFRNLSFKRKILFYGGAVSCLSLVLACGAFILNDVITIRQTLQTRTDTEAALLAKAGASALAFQDQDFALKLLAGLEADPHIVAACFYEADGAIFAKFSRQGTDYQFPAIPGELKHQFRDKYLDDFHPVLFGNEPVGTVFIRTDLLELSDKLKRYVGIAVGVLGLSFLIGLLLSLRLQRFLTRPVDELERVAKLVSDQKDYSVRSIKYNDDELGLLTDTFNKMLTEIQQRDVALRKNQESLLQYTDIVSSSRDMMALLDKNYVYLAANAPYFGAFGKTKDEVIGHTASEVFGEEFFEKSIKPNADRCLKGEDVDFQNWLEFPVYGRRFMDIAYSPYIDENKEVSRFVVIARDITKLKETEDEKAVLESHLHQAQKMEAIGTLAGGIAHDFNNILSPILGYTNLVLEDMPEESQARDDLEQVILAANRAKDLVFQILSFSRQSSQEYILLKIQYIIKESLKLLRASIPTTVEIRQNIDIQCGTIMSDPTQIHQVLMNLCTNAVHAMNEKGVLDINLREVTLNAEDIANKPELIPGPYACLSISDTGTGMDQKTISRIFEPFYTTKEAGKGTGLGLSVIHGIVANHKGMITVDSEPGKGTTFQVFFPIVGGEESVSPGISGPPPTGSERILLVDDEKMVADMGMRILKSLGYQVTTKMSSTEALELFRSQPDEYDLVITDQTMPDLAGAELSQELLKIRPDIPIILCSGYSSKVSKEDIGELGIRKFMAKPLDKGQLAAAIRKVLDGE